MFLVEEKTFFNYILFTSISFINRENSI